MKSLLMHGGRPGEEEQALRGGKLEMIRSYFRAWLDAALRIPADLEARARWKKKSRKPGQAMAYWLVRHRLTMKSLFTLETE